MANLNFDNRLLRDLPLDETYNNTPRQVPGAIFVRVPLTPLTNPSAKVTSTSALSLLGIDVEEEMKHEHFDEYFGGSREIPGSQPSAHCYCGHQFGYFSGQLGDGATMYLGEVINEKGERWELQFKGAGLTPFSRQGDGRKVLRSSLREFLCSEAMHHLGIPTTRAGTVVVGDDVVHRDPLGDGRVKEEQCTVITRIAPSFLRFGSFEVFKDTDSETGRKGPSYELRDELLPKYLDFTISSYFPEIEKALNDPTEKYLAFFEEVTRRTAALVARWQAVGFCHGVLNTDNMSILGLTLDYGPFGFMDHFNPDFICNSSDSGGRYSYANQPKMCYWNLERLADALSVVLPLEQSKQNLESIYWDTFKSTYNQQMKNKLGLVSTWEESDEALVNQLLETMQSTYADFTATFRNLVHTPLSGSLEDITAIIMRNCVGLEDIKEASRPSMSVSDLEKLRHIATTQPRMLMYLGISPDRLVKEIHQHAEYERLSKLSNEEHMASVVPQWMEWLSKYQQRVQIDYDVWKSKRDDTTDTDSYMAVRSQMMNSTNPKFILRNHIAQRAIEAAEGGDYSEVHRVFRNLQHPFDDEETSAASDVEGSGSKYACKAPSWALHLKVS